LIEILIIHIISFGFLSFLPNTNSSLLYLFKPSVIHQFLQHLNNYVQLSTEAQDALYSCLEEVTYNKNEYLVTEGKVCRYLYFLQDGALRGFYNLEGKEITYWFAFEEDFVTSFYSFISQKPAVENIQLLEGSILYRISKDQLNTLMASHHEIERLVRIAYEKYYLRLEERFINAQFKTATERYQDLLQQSPHILERVPLGYIASYLGISQETLSRVRSRH
jgi:CRP-like cAMP-binding protein